MKREQNKTHNLLNKVGMKRTDARVSLLEILSKSKKPLSAKEIFSKTSGDKVTTYRMLDTMVKKGLIKRVDAGGREAQYEIIDDTKDHHHIICLSCKKISDFTGCDADGLIKKALKQVKEFKSITHHSFDLFGVCNTCSKK